MTSQDRTVRLYHVPLSRSNEVLWLLEEIGAPYELTVLEPDERRGPEHRTRHPLGRVPVLEDSQGFVLESAAISLHLADLHPEAGLVPPVGTPERARAYQWVLYAMTELEPPLLDAMFMREAAPERAGSGAERFREAATLIEDVLSDRDFLLGDRFGVADAVLGSKLILGRSNGLVDGLERVTAYTERLEARPARQRAYAPATT